MNALTQLGNLENGAKQRDALSVHGRNFDQQLESLHCFALPDEMHLNGVAGSMIGADSSA